jgi:hypothetical protein
MAPLYQMSDLRSKFAECLLLATRGNFSLSLAVLDFQIVVFGLRDRTRRSTGRGRGALFSFDSRERVLDDVRFLIYASPRTISLGQQVMRSGPFGDTATSLQSVLACRSKVNAPVYSAQCRFLSCILARRKTAVDAGKKI